VGTLQHIRHGLGCNVLLAASGTHLARPMRSQGSGVGLTTRLVSRTKHVPSKHGVALQRTAAHCVAHRKYLHCGDVCAPYHNKAHTGTHTHTHTHHTCMTVWGVACRSFAIQPFGAAVRVVHTSFVYCSIYWPPAQYFHRTIGVSVTMHSLYSARALLQCI
jgi:hypothetical protein